MGGQGTEQTKIGDIMAYNIPLRIKHLVAKCGTANPAAIAETYGILVRFVSTPKNINGFWLRILRRKFIFCNHSLEHWQKQAVIAHELGHIILHPRYRHYYSGQSYYASKRHEDEANAFACELLKHLDIDPLFTLAFLENGWKYNKKCRSDVSENLDTWNGNI